MIWKWFPWKWLISRTMKSWNILDPFTVLARLRKFAEPSEVEAPLELVRAWTVFQARGIVNTRAIQHNLDWIWPYWVERQFNPRDPAFIPRSFSLSHVNLTHRNWTASCLPDEDVYSLVDPRGLVTPLYDGWSIDAWIVDGADRLIPSRCENVRQVMDCRNGLAIETEAANPFGKIVSRVEMSRGEDDNPVLSLLYRGTGRPGSFLCIALRPYNPEGVQFIDSIRVTDDRPGWLVNGSDTVLLESEPERYAASAYREGDISNRLNDTTVKKNAGCEVGMATAAALFRLDSNGKRTVQAGIPLSGDTRLPSHPERKRRKGTTWAQLDDLSPVLDIPDKHMQYLYRTSVRTLLSFSAGEIYPGSFTYRRFWFRDACLMLNSLLSLNHSEACRRSLEKSFPARQTMKGFFRSQDGEWDSNGQVLWLAGRYCAVARESLPAKTLKTIRKGARWLCRKRLARNSEEPWAGLLPAGFSAEHLGPNNYYYWDNFWGLAGLKSAALLISSAGDNVCADELLSAAEEFEHDIFAGIKKVASARTRGAVPAAPNRRMDAGAVGSLAADYPLRLVRPGDSRIMSTVEFLLDNCMLKNAFFHDITHSGINPYLTLHLAQVLLRAGDKRYIPLVKSVAEHASSAGQWPEAIHPATAGGCMGDGQHGWAAAEWVMMMRGLFVREEEDRLVVAPGLFPEWLNSGEDLRFGPTSTKFGTVTVRVDTGGDRPEVKVDGSWHGSAPDIEIGPVG